MMIEAILAALLKLGAPTQVAPEVASAIVKYAHSADEAAFMVVDGKHESHYLERLIAGRCERWECDSRRLADGTLEFRAIGAWQARRGIAGKDWLELPGNLDAQARVAARMTRFALKTCEHAEDPIRGAFAVLGGKRCDETFKGIDARVQDFRKVRAAL